MPAVRFLSDVEIQHPGREQPTVHKAGSIAVLNDDAALQVSPDDVRLLKDEPKPERRPIMGRKR